jgi:peptidoglycan-associated lipoprotein
VSPPTLPTGRILDEHPETTDIMTPPVGERPHAEAAPGATRFQTHHVRFQMAARHRSRQEDSVNSRVSMHRSLACAAIVLSLLAIGCPKKQPPASAEPPPAPPAEKPMEQVQVPREPMAEPTPSEAPVKVEGLDETIRAQNENRAYLKTVYFDFDQFELRGDATATLKSNATWLKSHPNFKVVVEGHADERGTIEYNLELGAKRARAVLDYLVTLGVDGSRMRTISYGEERPAVSGHDESSWSRNRRAEFTLEK